MKPDQAGALQVAVDSLVPSSTMISDDGDLYTGLQTDLYVTVPATDKALCKKAFLAHNVKFGRISLGGTNLTAISVAGSEVQAVEMATAKAVEVYLTWDEQYGRLMLEDAAGLIPSLDSATFRFASGAPDYYYLKAAAHLTIVRGSSASSAATAATTP